MAKQKRKPVRRSAEFRLHIDAYTPETIPLERLAEYLFDLAVLLGERTSVHFKKLESGSVDPVIGVDYEAIPKVVERVQNAKINEGPREPRDAIRALNQKLEEDNGSGVLVGPTGGKLIVFPGRARPSTQSYGPFNQAGVLEGTLVAVGGTDDLVPVHLQDLDGSVYSVCRASRELAKELAPYLFTTPLRVEGTARWYRDQDGVWELKGFRIHSFELLHDDTLGKAVARLRKVNGAWKDTPDPLAVLAAIRGGGDSTVRSDE